MKKFILHCLLLFTVSFTYSQQGNNWYFGDHAGITFSTSPPGALYNSSLSTLEGCSTISDANGLLLFYTDGRFVYNRNHQLMPNGSGLAGHPSASNSAIIVREPGSDSLYYIFTVDASENNFSNGYRYSIVDMSLNAGLGDVSVKNILLYAKCSEKITAVKHANGTDAWIVTKDFFGDTYKVYKLGCNGLDMNPVISHAGIVYGNTDFRVGSIKASPDGNKIATVQFFKGWELFDFDKATGILSNPLFIPISPQPCLFGLEFSPNSQLLYIASECGAHGNGEIFQYKINVHDSLTISNSKYLVDNSEFSKGDMQLGPDEKIYIPNEQDSSLNVINAPNQYGPACDYSYKAIHLGNGRLAMRSLPAFFKDNISSSTTDFSFIPLPDCSAITFTGTSSLPAPLSWFWDFGDGNTASGQTVTHSFGTNGSFPVKLTVTNPNICGAIAIRTKALNSYSIPPVANFSYNLQCGNKSVQFFDSSIISSGNIAGRIWDFGDGQNSTIKNPRHSYSNPGSYQVKLKVVSFGICPREDSMFAAITIYPTSPASVALGGDTSICTNETFILHAGSGFKNYYWQDGSTDSTFIVTQPGKYYIVVNDYCGHSFTDSILVTQKESTIINLGSDTSICINSPLLLNAGAGFIRYVWNTGDTSQFKLVNNAGIFSVTVINNLGCTSKDTIQILNAFPSPILSLNKTHVLCLDQNNTINAGGGFLSYAWQNGITDSIITVSSAGWYKVTVSNIHNCISADSVQILAIAKLPSDFLPDDLSACSDEQVSIYPKQTFNEYLWSSGSRDRNIAISPPQKIWLQVTDINSCKGTDTINIYSKDFSTLFYIPNAFTPNNDRLNETFKPLLSGRLEQYSFSVYNIYGQLIFSSNVPNKGWDGTYKMSSLNPGVFVWYCKYKAKNETTQLAKGYVLLIR